MVKMKLIILIIIGLIAACVICAESLPPDNRTIIMANQNDPFYPLAVEISQHERIPIAQTLEAVTRSKKEFLLWVVSPVFMSDEVIISFSAAMKNRKHFPSPGIISGYNIEEARELYERGRKRITGKPGKNQVHLSIAYAGNYKLALSRQGDLTGIPFTKESLSKILPDVDVLFFWGHGGNTYFKIKKKHKFFPRHIPRLPGTIIKSGSCNSFRIWRGHSIALEFIKKGADAFVGYSYSPVPFYMQGYFKNPPLINSFAGVPLGHIVHMQNKADLKGFSRLPYLFLLGDPRIFLQHHTPYNLVEDKADKNARRLKFRSHTRGYLPVRIPGGAKYDFLQIGFPRGEKEKEQITLSYWEHSPWYYSKVQTLNLNQDKLIVFEHQGGEFSVHLRTGPSSVLYPITHSLLNSLDYNFIFCAQTGGDVISSIFVIILAAWFIAIKRKTPFAGLRENLVKGILVGIVFSLSLFFYTSTRAHRMTIISSPREFVWFTVIMGFFLAALGSVIYFHITVRWKKIVCFIMVLSPVLVAIFFWTASILVANIMLLIRIKKAIYNGSVVYLSLVTMIVEIVFFTLMFLSFKRIGRSPFNTMDDSIGSVRGNVGM